MNVTVPAYLLSVYVLDYTYVTLSIKIIYLYPLNMFQTTY